MDSFIDHRKTTENELKLGVCQEFKPIVTSTFLKKTDLRRLTWYRPRGKGAVPEIILMNGSQDILISDARSSRQADANFEHYLVTVIAETKRSNTINQYDKKCQWKTCQLGTGQEQIRL